MKDAFKHLGWFFRANKGPYTVCAIFLVIVSVLPIFPAWFLGQAIDEIANGTITWPKFFLYVLSLGLIPLGTYLANLVYHYTINSLGHRVSYLLREKYLNHLFQLDATSYEKYPKGDLIARAMNDLNTLTVLATSFLQQVVHYTCLIIASVIMMLIINPLLTLAATFFMPIAIFWLNRRRLKRRQYYKIHREIYADMTEKVLESIEGVKSVRAYGQEENDFAKTKKAIDADIDSWWKILKFETLYGPLFEHVYALAYGIALALGCYFVIHTRMTGGNLVTFLMYIGMLYGPLIGLSNILNTVNDVVIADGRFQEIMDIEPLVKDIGSPQSVIRFKSIEFKEVSFKYPFDNFEVIRGINLTINSGETIGIVGPTGAGKSTLIRQLLREFNVTSGEVLIDGLDIKSYKIEDVHNLVGYVPQAHVLFRKSVDDNILLGKPKASLTDIDEAMVIADFKKDLSELPYGSSTMVAELGSSLSGGQRQRLSIARALIKQPEILILDDSLSAVDALTEANIIKQLQMNRKWKTNIIVAHRFSAISASDKIVVIQGGKVTDIGTHQELLKYDNWYKSQYLKQIAGGIYEESKKNL